MRSRRFSVLLFSLLTFVLVCWVLISIGCGGGSNRSQVTQTNPNPGTPPPGGTGTTSGTTTTGGTTTGGTTMGGTTTGGTTTGGSTGGTGGTTTGGTGGTTGGTTTSSAPGRAMFLYGSSGQGVKGGTIDPNTGQVVSVAMPTDRNSGVTAFDTGSGGFVGAIAIDRLGRFLFTADVQTFHANEPIGNNAIGAFTIDRNSGVLTRIAGSPYVLSQRPQDIAIDGTGRFVYVSLPETGTIDIWSVNQSSGALTHAGSSAGGGAQLATTWDGRFLLSNANNAVTSFSIDQATGGLTPASTVVLDKSNGLSLSIGNKQAYSWTGNTATVLTLDSDGKLALGRTGITLQGGDRALYISVGADNRMAFVTIQNQSTGQGHLVRYDGIGGDQLGVFGTNVMHAEVDFNGKFVYAANGGGGPLQTYVFNPNGGFGPGPMATGPVANVQFFRLSP